MSLNISFHGDVFTDIREEKTTFRWLLDAVRFAQFDAVCHARFNVSQCNLRKPKSTYHNTNELNFK